MSFVDKSVEVWHCFRRNLVEGVGVTLSPCINCKLVPLDKMCIFPYFFFRNHQQNVKVLWKRTCEAKRIYDLKCREEVASNQFYHQEVARCGKISKEAEKVSIEVLMWRHLHLLRVKKNPVTQSLFIRFPFFQNLIANISFYALSWPKLNFGCYLTFEIIF